MREYNSPAYKRWAQEQDKELQQRRASGDYGTWDMLADGLAMIPEKTAAWVADQDMGAKMYSGDQFTSAGDERSRLFEQMRAVSDKQFKRQPLSEQDKRTIGDWNALKNSGSVWMKLPTR